MSSHEATLAGGEIERSSERSIVGKFLMVPIEIICVMLLVALITLVLSAVFFRYMLHSPLFWADEVAALLFLWLSMLGAVVALDRGEHMRLSLMLMLIPARYLAHVQALASVATLAFLACFLWPTVEHVQFEAIIRSPALELSQGYRLSAIATGVALMLVVMLEKTFREASLRDIAAAAVLIALVLLFFWQMKPALIAMGELNILFFLAGLSLACLLLGVPIAFCFGIGTLSFLAFSTTTPLTVMVGRIDEGMSNPILISVPVFVLLGCILDATGMGKAIVDFVSSLFGHVKAGMSYVMFGSLYLVSGISGSKVSDMATVAPALFPEMKRRGNRPSEMVAQLSTGAVMADTVPPSIMLIVLGSVAGLSIGHLFTSGFVIAFVLMLSLAAVARWRSRKENLANVKRATAGTVFRTLLIAAPALVLPFLIRAAVGGGVATASEVSTVAVAYSIVVGLLLYGGLTPRKMFVALVDTAALSGAILLIMGTTLAAAWALTQTGFANHLAEIMSTLPGGWIGFMLVSIVVFLLMGCLLEGMPALVLLAPLMFPIAHNLGIHGIHYAMVVVVAMNIGLFTPPIGVGFYIACGIGRTKPDEAMRAVWGYLLALIVGLLLIAFIPAISIGYLD